MKNNRVLTWVASVILVVSIILCAFTLWYVINSKDTLSKELKDLRQQLQQYNFPKDETKDVTVEEAKLYLAVAKYCEENNGCKGKDGVSPACIFDVNQCQGAEGKTPIKGVDYVDGTTPPCYFTINQCVGDNGTNGKDGGDGKPGADGKPVERRCNAELNRMEWRLVGDEAWQPEYNLAPGQTCVEGV